MQLKSIPVLATLFLAGCASAPVSIDSVASQTQSVNDPFQKLTWIIGPYVRYNDHKGYSGKMYLCQANGTGMAQFLLGVENSSDDREIFTGAASITGDTLAVQPMGYTYDGDQYCAKVRVSLSKDLLTSSEATGLTVRLYGQRRVLDVTIPGAYITGFLEKAR